MPIPIINLIDNPIPKRKKDIINKNYNVISEEFSYMLGAILGDGTISKRKGYIQLMVRDKDFALRVKSCIEIWTKMKCYYSEKFYKNVIFYIVRFNSIDIINYILNFNIEELNKCDEKIIYSFINGFLDAEGSIKKDGRILAWNTNEELLVFVSDLLDKLGIANTFTLDRLESGNNKIIYLLTIKRKEVIKFHDKIEFSIKRKQERLNLLLKNSNKLL